MPTVSIVIPCFNAGEFLEEAVDSALQQTHQEVEVIIVDDGSTDTETCKLLNAAPWEGVRILRQENKGLPAARNAGIQAATGEFILPLDADDRIAAGYAEMALAVLTQNPGIGIVYCRAELFGEASGEWDLPPYNLHDMILRNLIFCTAMFRKSDWANVGGYCEDLRQGLEDYDFWIKLIAAGAEVHRLDEVLFHYRVKASSMIKQFYADDRTAIVTNAQIFRNNIEFFAQHAEVLFEHRFGLYRRIDDLEKPVQKLETLLRKYPWLRSGCRWLYRFVIGNGRPKDATISVP